MVREENWVSYTKQLRISHTEYKKMHEKWNGLKITNMFDILQLMDSQSEVKKAKKV